MSPRLLVPPVVLALAACDHTPDAPPGGFRDATAPGDDVIASGDGGDAAPEPAACEDWVADFTTTLWQPTLQPSCSFCHRQGGLAAATDLVLVAPTNDDAIRRDLAALATVARKTIDGESVLLLRPTGRHPEGHPGGAPVALETDAYDALADFVAAAGVCRFDPPEGPAVCDPTGPRLLRRLSRDEWAQTIGDVLGVAADPSALAPDDVVAGFDNQASALGVSALLVDQIRGEAERIARIAIETRLPALVDCAPSEACALRFTARVGLSLYRRPLTDGELAAYRDLYRAVATTDPPREAMVWVLAAMLQSPHFLYRSELGVQGEAPGVFTLTDWELASAISYLAWGTAPDETLLRLASDGALSDPTRLEAELTRLLADPRSDRTLERFGTRWLRLDLLPVVTRDATVYPELTPEVRRDMAGEAARFLTAVAADGGTVADLLLARRSFMTDRLAAYYGLAPGAGPADDAGFRAVDLAGTPYAGLLARGAVLTTHALPLSSSPIHRGKLVRERLFCEDLPPPPSNLDTSPPPVDPSLSTRERYANHAASEECATCHRKIDPIGFALESFDGIGRHRDRDGIHPIDDSGTIHELDGADVDIEGADGLAAALASSPTVDRCYVLQQARFSWGYEPAECTIDALADATDVRGGALRDAPFALAMHPAMRHRHGDPAELDSLAVGTFDFDAIDPDPPDPTEPDPVDPGPVTDSFTWTVMETTSWQTGYCVNVDVRNTTTETAAWVIDLTVEGRISNLWNATSAPGDGGKLRFSGVEWNASLGPGASTSFGYCADR